MLKHKKGDTVSLFAFTGMNIGQFTVTDSDKTTITLVTHNGKKTGVYDRKTGKQTNAKNPQFANYITEDVGPPDRSKKSKAGKAKEAAAKKAAAEKAEKEKPKKPSATKKTEQEVPAKGGKPAKKVTQEPDDEYEEEDFEYDDDEDEDDDDDDDE